MPWQSFAYLTNTYWEPKFARHLDGDGHTGVNKIKCQ